MIPGLGDPPVREHAEERAPGRWGPLVSTKRHVCQPWKDPPSVEPRGTEPGAGDGGA